MKSRFLIATILISITAIIGCVSENGIRKSQFSRYA